MPRATCLWIAALLTSLMSIVVWCQSPQAHNRPVSSAPQVVTGLGRGTVALDGQWQFQIGDDPSWASPAFDDSNWEQIDIGKPWGDQGHWAYSGYAWYRKRIELRNGPDDANDVRLYMPAELGLYEVYWNGRMVGHFGTLPGSPSQAESPPLAFSLESPGSGVLAFRVWASTLDSSAPGNNKGLIEAPRLGNRETITNLLEIRYASNVRNNLLEIVQILTYFQLSLVGLLVWRRNRNQKLLFWMILFFFSAALWTFFNSAIFPWRFSVPILFSSPFHSLEDIALWYLLLYLLDLDRFPSLMRLTRILAVVSLISAFLDDVVFSVAWSGVHTRGFQVLDALFTAGFSIPQIYPLVLIPFAFRERLDPARRFVAVTAFLAEMYYVVQHSATQGRRFTHWTLGETMLRPLFQVKGIPVLVTDFLSLLLVISIVNAVYRYSVEEGRRQRAILEEYKSAQELQRMLIPEALPALPGYAVSSAYRPAAEVGGDFFQLIPLAKESTMVVIGDVSGKGLKAAMAVSLIVGALRTLAETSDDPAVVMAGLNRRLFGRLPFGFVTCLVMRLGRKGECVMANAGHLPPFLNQREIDLPFALPLGVVSDASYNDAFTYLKVDDRLTLYTDGLLEARNPAGELYSFDRLAHLMASRPDASKAVEAAVAFGQEDDITVLTLTRLATGVESTTSLFAPDLASLSA
jgi:hypothetical protein